MVAANLIQLYLISLFHEYTPENKERKYSLNPMKKNVDRKIIYAEGLLQYNITKTTSLIV